MKTIHRGEKGFTLIELLVVIAILGVIAAVVSLSVAGFFGRGTLQAANTELHQAQTAIIAAMADAGSNDIVGDEDIPWAGEKGKVEVKGPHGTFDAANYIYGPFRALYTVCADTGTITAGICHVADGETAPDGFPGNPWGSSIEWGDNNSWEKND